MPVCQCIAAKTGKRCRLEAKTGSKYCHLHQKCKTDVSDQKQVSESVVMSSRCHCVAKKTGKRCLNAVKKGSKYCHLHSKCSKDIGAPNTVPASRQRVETYPVVLSCIYKLKDRSEGECKVVVDFVTRSRYDEANRDDFDQIDNPIFDIVKKRSGGGIYVRVYPVGPARAYDEVDYLSG